MVESTHLKDISAKMDTILAAIDQRDEKIKMLEQSITTITHYIENHQAQIASSSLATTVLSMVANLLPTEPLHLTASPWCSVKLDFPRFDVSDPLQWIFRAEQFFKFYEILDPFHLKFVAVHMEGPVISWFQMLQRSSSLTGWTSLVQAMESAYGPSVFDCLRYALFKLQQQHTVYDYCTAFTTLANRVDGLSQSDLLNCFISGLK